MKPAWINCVLVVKGRDEGMQVSQFQFLLDIMAFVQLILLEREHSNGVL